MRKKKKAKELDLKNALRKNLRKRKLFQKKNIKLNNINIFFTNTNFCLFVSATNFYRLT